MSLAFCSGWRSHATLQCNEGLGSIPHFGPVGSKVGYLCGLSLGYLCGLTLGLSAWRLHVVPRAQMGFLCKDSKYQNMQTKLLVWRGEKQGNSSSGQISDLGFGWEKRIFHTNSAAILNRVIVYSHVSLFTMVLFGVSADCSIEFVVFIPAIGWLMQWLVSWYASRH